MSYTLAVIFAFSIVIAAILGLIRYNKINKTYFPFIYCIWIGALNEILGFTLSRMGYHNTINNNIYVLVESLLFTWQFRNWGLFKRNKFGFHAILAIFVIFWLIECIVFKGIYLTTSYFRTVYSFVIVLMSINILNEKLLTERKNILRNPVFLICIGFVLYYTYKVIVGMFWMYGLRGSREFRMNVVWILIYINFISNLIYAFAVLCMPQKHRFSRPY